MNNVKFRLINIFLIIIILFTIPINTYADEKSSDFKKIRVGYYLVDGYHEIDKNGVYSGYSYDYLQAIAQYSNWQYEFVVAPFNECLEMLKNGEIDLMDTLAKTEEREKTLEYSQYEGGNGNSQIITLASKKIAYNDFEAFNNLKIGIVKNIAIKDKFIEFSRENDFSVEIIEFDTTEEMYTALNNGIIDAISDTKEKNDKRYRTISKFNYTPFYFATTKDKKEIIDTIDDSIEKIKSYSLNFNSQLEKKYFDSNIGVSAVFTKEEQEYLKNHKVIRAAYDPKWNPIEYKDEKTGNYSGIMAEIFRLLSDSTGITFEFTAGNNFSDTINKFNSEKFDILTAISQDYDWANKCNVFLTQPIIDAPVVTVSKNNDNKSGYIALPKGYFTSDKISKITTKDKILYFDTIEECFNAIYNDEADITLVNTYVADYYLKNFKYKNFSFDSSLGYSENISIGVSKNTDLILISILNKAIRSISSDEIKYIVNNNSFQKTTNNFFEILFNNPIESTLFICLILGLIILTLIFAMTSKNRQNKYLKAKQQEDSKVKEVLRKKSEIDNITEIYNMQTFCRKTSEMITQNSDNYYAIVRWDIERFKVFNDLFGIEKGNELLLRIGHYLKKIMREIGTYGHIYADHFVMCFSLNTLEIENLVDSITENLNSKGYSFQFIPVFGIYLIDDTSIPIDLMCDRAGLAQKKIKGNYLKHYAYYNENLRERLIDEQKIVDQMSTALEEKQFIVYFQPQYNYSSKKLSGAEALVRWKHPTKGLIPPNIFIPIFEKNLFITKLDQYVWESVCQSIQKWKGEGKALIPISVNISRIDIYNTDLAKILSDLVNKYKIDPSLLNLEITETAYVENPIRLINVVKQLQEKGFIVEMDDFGSGYSSLNTLKDVPVDVLKLDMRFIEDDKNSQRGGNILNSVVRMAKWLNLPIIAEGVETINQAEFLKSIGCDYMQGYYFSKPIPKSIFENILNNSEKTALNKNELILNNINVDEFWEPNNKNSLVFNICVGGAAIFEYKNKTLEILRVNNKFFQVINSTREDFEQQNLNLFDFIYEKDRNIFIEMIDKASVSFDEVESEVRWKNEINKKIWLKIRSKRIASSNNNGIILFITIENITDKKKLEMEKEKSQIELMEYFDFLHSLYQRVPYGIVQFDYADNPDKSVIIDFNDACWKIFGYKSHKEFQNKISIDNYAVIYEEDRSIVKNVFNECRNFNKCIDYEIRIIKSNGEIGYTRSTLDIVSLPDGSKVFQNVFMDITNEKKAENDIMISKYSSILYAIFDEIFTIDIQENKFDIVYSNINNDFEKLTRPTVVETINHLTENFIYEEDRKKFAEFMNLNNLKNSLNGKNSCFLEVRTINKSDNNGKWVSIRIIKITDNIFLGCIKDININKLNEELHKEKLILEEKQWSQERYRIILEQTNTVVFELNYSDEKFYCSKNISMFSAHEYNFNSFKKDIFKDDLIYCDDKNVARNCLNDIKNKKPYCQYVVRLKTKDNSYKWCKITFNLVLNDNNDILRIIGTVTLAEEEINAKINLEESVEKFQNIITNIPAGVGIYEISDTIRPIYVNNQFCIMFGYSEQEYIENLKNGLLPDWLKVNTETLSEEMLCDIDKGLPFEFIIPTIKKNNQRFKVRIVGSIVKTKGNKKLCYFTIVDLTDKIKQQETLHLYEEKYKLMIESTRAITFEYDLEADCFTYNRPVKGIGLNEVIIDEFSKKILDSKIIHKDYIKKTVFVLNKAIKTKIVGDFDFLLNMSNSGFKWYRTNYASIDDDNGKVYKIVGRIDDIQKEMTKFKRIENYANNLKEKAEYDSVTGLLNRATAQEMIINILNKHTKEDKSIFAMFDIDDFKNINDNYGHLKGDELLKSIGKTVKKHISNDDIIGRIGGDEFIIYIKNSSDYDKTIKNIEEMMSEINKLNKLIDIELPTSISVGIVLINETNLNYNEVFNYVDKALYLAKKSGKNQYVVFDDLIEG